MACETDMPTSTRLPMLLALVAALAAAPSASAAKRPVTPTLGVAVAQAPDPVRPGNSATVALTVTPPEGILLNRYPGIRLRITPSDVADASEPEVFVGSRTPIEDPDEVYFDGPVPIGVDLVTKRGAREAGRLEGQLRFFYCVKKSGFCAPGRQDVSIPIALSDD